MAPARPRSPRASAVGRSLAGRRGSSADVRPYSPRTTGGGPPRPTPKAVPSRQSSSGRAAEHRKLYGTGPKDNDDDDDAVALAASAHDYRDMSMLERCFAIQDPDSTMLRWWDAVTIFVIVFSVFYTLMEVAWPNFLRDTRTDTGMRPFVFLYWVQFGFFCADLVKNFFTGYVTADLDVVMDRGMVARKYATSWFLIDFISNVPDSATSIFVSKGDTSGVDVGRVIKLLKLLRFTRIPRVMARWVQRGANQKLVLSMQVLISLTTAAHLVACVFFIIGVQDAYEVDTEWEGQQFEAGELNCCKFPNNWLCTFPARSDSETDCTPFAGMDAGKINYLSIWGQYTSALYFGVVTLTTVGYGDLSGTNHTERGVLIFGCIVGSAVFASIASVIGTLMESEDVREKELSKKLQQINRFMSQAHTPMKLREQIRRFYDVSMKSGGSLNGVIGNVLPSHLQRGMLLAMYSEFADEVPFLEDSDAALRLAFCERMEKQAVAATEYVVIEGELMRHLVVVAAGSVEKIDVHGVTVRLYTQGSFFAEQCGLSAFCYAESSYRARTDIEIMTLGEEDMRYLYAAFPDFLITMKRVLRARKQHSEQQKKKGGAKLGKMMKDQMSDIRPVTPPLGKTWLPMKAREKSVGKAIDRQAMRITRIGGGGLSARLSFAGRFANITTLGGMDESDDDDDSDGESESGSRAGSPRPSSPRLDAAMGAFAEGDEDEDEGSDDGKAAAPAAAAGGGSDFGAARAILDAEKAAKSAAESAVAASVEGVEAAIKPEAREAAAKLAEAEKAVALTAARAGEVAGSLLSMKSTIRSMSSEMALLKTAIVGLLGLEVVLQVIGLVM